MRTIEEFHGDYTYELQRAYMTGFLQALYGEKLDKWLAERADRVDIRVNVEFEGLHINDCTHEQVVELIKLFGTGDWEKEVYYEATFQYRCNVGQDGKVPHSITIIGGPPAACQIIEEEVVVPERKEIRRKVVCPQAPLPEVVKE